MSAQKPCKKCSGTIYLGIGHICQTAGCVHNFPMPMKSKEPEMSDWISVDDRLPKCSSKPESFGTEVLVYPPTREGDRTAFYGRRVSRKPCFYRYGAPITPQPNYWMPLPEPPK